MRSVNRFATVNPQYRYRAQAPCAVGGTIRSLAIHLSHMCIMPAGKLKAKDLVEFLKPFAGPKGGATPDAKKPAGTTDSKSSGGGGADKPFADQQAGSGAKPDKPKAARKQAAEAAEDVQDPVSAVVDLTADDLPAVLEGDEAWLFGVFDGEWGTLSRM